MAKKKTVKSNNTAYKLKKARGFSAGAGTGKRKIITKTPTSIYVKKEKSINKITPKTKRKL